MVFGTGILTGHFWDVTAVFFIVIIHELGHALSALWFGWRLTSIELLPFGGVAKVDEYGNRSTFEEFVVTLAGPLQHLWLPLISFLLLATPYWNEANHNMFLLHNHMLLLFNLLPIWPLDGGKLLMLLLSKWVPFRSAYRQTLILSFFILLLLSLYMIISKTFLLNFFVIAVFLGFSIIKEWKQQRYVFMRFLLECWKSSQRGQLKERNLLVSPDMTLSEILEGFYKNKHHRIVVKDKNTEKEIEEKVLLDAFFNKHSYHYTIGQLLY